MLEPDDLDRRLDSALATYAEPRTGIEQRMLARIRDAREARRAARRRWLVWAIPIPLAACIVLYMWISAVKSPRENHVQPMPPREQAFVQPAQSSQRELPRLVSTPQSERASSLIRRRSVHVATTVIAGPKLDVFPSPEPLTAQEQALVALAAQPAGVREQVLAEGARRDRPLQVSQIEIPPIPPSDEGQK